MKTRTSCRLSARMRRIASGSSPAPSAPSEMVTRTLAVEWADRNVRVNSIAPGYLETDMTVGLRENERWWMTSEVYCVPSASMVARRRYVRS